MVLGCIHFFILCNIQEVMNFHTQQGFQSAIGGRVSGQTNRRCKAGPSQSPSSTFSIKVITFD
jgi:hypothetical protein